MRQKSTDAQPKESTGKRAKSRSVARKLLGSDDPSKVVSPKEKSMQNHSADGGAAVTAEELQSFLAKISQSMLSAPADRKRKLASVKKSIEKLLDSDGVAPTTSPAAKPTEPATIYQFKITLYNSDPAIWRRIQIHDCTLDELHEHIQCAMGWENSHLHIFEIDDKKFGDPWLLEEGFEEWECIDSTKTKLSEILPPNKKQFTFDYEYDFGDGWKHEVRFEGNPKPHAMTKYPICMEGERACPPEDSGGIWSYPDLLAALSDKQHPDHHDMRAWVGRRFNPDTFDANKATKAMKKGLPDWRENQ